MNEDFDSQLEFFHAEVSSAIQANALGRYICNLHGDFSIEFNQSATFWYIVRKALNESVIMRLSRVFIRQKDSIALFELLTFIRDNLDLFSKENFEERKKSGAFGISFDAVPRELDLKELEADIVFSDPTKNPILIKLKNWRHKRFAHIDKQIAVGNWDSLKGHEIDADEIDVLISRCHNILNTYSLIFKASIYASNIHMHDDIRYTLDLVRLGMLKREQDIHDEFEAWENRLASAEKLNK